MAEKYTIVKYFHQNGYIDNLESYNYLEIFHNLVIELINNEKYKNLVSLCYHVFAFDPNNSLIPKIIFTLINLNENRGAIELCEMYLKYNPTNKIFYNAVNEFLKYGNYSGAIDLCVMYLKINPKGNLDFIHSFILECLEKGKNYSKILELIELFLEESNGDQYIFSIIYSMIQKQNYLAVVDLSKLILESDLKYKLVILQITRLICDNGRFVKAKDLCINLLKLFPNSLDVLSLYGSILTITGKFNQALKLFRSILNNLSKKGTSLKSNILNLIGRVYLEKGDLKSATIHCIKSMKLNPRNAEVYNNLGYIYYKKGYIEKAIKLIRRALKLDKFFCSAWITLGEIYLKMKKYYEAFSACYKCLSINNLYQEGLNLYKKLTDHHDLKILSYLIPRITHLGYRCGFDSLDDTVFPNELQKSHNYISYSKEFQSFLKGIRLAQMYLNDFISIYCWLPKCMKCDLLLKLYGERLDYKTGSKIKMYRCEECGKEKREIYKLNDEEMSQIKIRVILKKPFVNFDGSQLIYSKLDYERILITYISLTKIKNQTKNDKIEFNNSLKNAFLLYGKEIRTNY
ncbi:MAG: tetratricopeptide repeat protein [Promethearchaeota archaeon]